MTDASLEQLLERVRQATGPDREIDAHIWAYRNSMTVVGYRKAGLDVAPGWYCKGLGKRKGFFHELPHAGGVTSSIDACLALMRDVLPGWRWYMAMGRSRPDEPLYGASLLAPERSADDEPDAIAEHEHGPALALLDCILQALISHRAMEKTDAG